VPGARDSENAFHGGNAGKTYKGGVRRTLKRGFKSREEEGDGRKKATPNASAQQEKGEPARTTRQGVKKKGAAGILALAQNYKLEWDQRGGDEGGCGGNERCPLK